MKISRSLFLLVLFLESSTWAESPALSELDQKLMQAILTGNRYDTAVVVKPSGEIQTEPIPPVGSVGDLLKKGANANAAYKNGFTALMVAFENGNAYAAKLLLKQGADPNAMETEQGRSVLHIAAQMLYTKPELIELLVKKGAKIDPVQTETGFTPLMIAVASGNKETAKALIKNGADVRIKSADGQSILSMAEQTHDAELIELIRTASR